MAEQPVTTGDGRAAVGRAAAANLAWDAAFEAFSEADAASPLDVEDLQLWATAAYLLGQVDAAVTALARAHQTHLDRDDAQAALYCGFWIIFMLLGRGEVAQAGGWLGRCGHLMERVPADCAEQGYIAMIEAFRLTAIEQRYAEGQASADRVVGIARRTGDEDLLALALNVAGRARIRVGAVDEGLAHLDEAMVAVVSGRLSPPAAGTVYCSLIEACNEIAERRRAREWTDALARWCDRQRGMITFTGQCHTHRATIFRQHGKWEDAAAEAKQACERFVGAADEQTTGTALYELGEIYRLAGNLTAAEDSYRSASDWGHDPQPGLSLLRLAEGHTDAAAATMRRVVAEREAPSDRIRMLPAHVEIMLAASDIGTAAEAADELHALAATYNTSALLAEAYFASGAVCLAEDDPGRALVSLRRAYQTWQSLEAPYETARTRVLLSQACRDFGDNDTAALELEAARRTFAELGAGTELSRLPSAARSDRSGLSTRELEVLRLVATGKSNSEVAVELQLATKTVERHVANILTKLGVASRTAATAFAYEHRLL